MGHTLTNHHRVITRQSQPMQQQQAAARSVSPDAAAARRLHDWPELGFAAVLDEVDFLSHPPTPWNTVDAKSRLGAGYHNLGAQPRP